MKGLKHIEKETVGVQSKTAAAVSSEELSLLARLDELEEKETANAELHHWDDFDNDNKNSVQYSSKDDDVTQEKSSVAQDKEIGRLIRKVKWNDFDGAKDSGSNSGDSDDYGEGNGEVKTTIAVKFSTSPRSILQKVCKYFKTVCMASLRRKPVSVSSLQSKVSLLSAIKHFTR